MNSQFYSIFVHPSSLKDLKIWWGPRPPGPSGDASPAKGGQTLKLGSYHRSESGLLPRKMKPSQLRMLNSVPKKILSHASWELLVRYHFDNKVYLKKVYVCVCLKIKPFKSLWIGCLELVLYGISMRAGLETPWTYFPNAQCEDLN